MIIFEYSHNNIEMFYGIFYVVLVVVLCLFYYALFR
jgi:hypothetical protein